MSWSRAPASFRAVTANSTESLVFALSRSIKISATSKVETTCREQFLFVDLIDKEVCQDLSSPPALLLIERYVADYRPEKRRRPSFVFSDL